MTKKETDLFDGLVILIKQNMEVQQEILATLRQINNPPFIVSANGPVDIKPGPVTMVDPEVKPGLTESEAGVEKAPAPVIPEPKKYTIEDCRLVLGQMVEKLGEAQAWAYLKTFKVEMLPDLDPSQYAELVEGAEKLLA